MLQLLRYWLTASMVQAVSRRANIWSTNKEVSPHFMKPEGSLAYLQKPVAGLFANPDDSSPYCHPPFPEDPSTGNRSVPLRLKN
jgi:hypothetical protein